MLNKKYHLNIPYLNRNCQVVLSQAIWSVVFGVQYISEQFLAESIVLALNSSPKLKCHQIKAALDFSFNLRSVKLLMDSPQDKSKDILDKEPSNLWISKARNFHNLVRRYIKTYYIYRDSEFINL